jgi:integrase
VDKARDRFLTIDEARRLINGCDPDFRALVRGALETGARYQELARLRVTDYKPDNGTVAVHAVGVRKSKTRYVILTAEGSAFFKGHTAGRAGSELMFHHAIGNRDGTLRPWKKSEQAEPMKLAVERGKIDPPITFHGLRHTWASHAVMNLVPLKVVADNLGHVDTSMVERTYGHWATTAKEAAIRSGGPKYGIVEPDTKVVPMR